MPRSFSEIRTGTLIVMLGTPRIYGSDERLEMERELNERFAGFDDQYFKDVQAMRDAEAKDKET